MKNKLLLTIAVVLACVSQINAETPYRTQELTFNQQTEQAIVNLLSGQENPFNISNQTVETYVYHLSDGEIIALAQANPGLVQALNQLELVESAEFVSRVLVQVPTEKDIEPRDTHDPSFIVTADTMSPVQPTAITVPLSPKPPTNEPPAPAKSLVKARAEAKSTPLISNKLNKLASDAAETVNNAIKGTVETVVYYSKTLSDTGRTAIETVFKTVKKGVEETGKKIQTLTDSAPTDKNKIQITAKKDPIKVQPKIMVKKATDAKTQAKNIIEITNKANKLASDATETINNTIKKSIETATYYSEVLNNTSRAIVKTTLETVQEGVEEAGQRIKTFTDSIPTNPSETQAIAEKNTAKTQRETGVSAEAKALAIALDKYNAVDREMTKAINQYNAAIESGAETQVVTAALDRLNAVTQEMTQAADQYNTAVEAQKAADTPNNSENSETNVENNNSQTSTTEHEVPTSQSEKVTDVDKDKSNSAETEEQDNSSHTHEEASNGSNDNNNDSTTDTTDYTDGNELNDNSRTSSPVTYNADIDDYSDTDHSDDISYENTNISNTTPIDNADPHDINVGDYDGYAASDSDSSHDSGSSPNIDNSGLSSVGGAVGAGIGISAGDGGSSDSGLSSVGNTGIGISIGGSTVGIGIGGGAVGAGLGISVDGGAGVGNSGAVGAAISVSTGGTAIDNSSSNNNELSPANNSEVQ